MFSSLFGDDNDGVGNETDAFLGNQNGKKSFSVSPPRPRLECNMAGIENQGATCYLNSLLQTLLLTPEFREALFQIPKEELGCLEDKDKPNSKVRVIPLQLQRLFVRLLLSNRQSVSTRDLTESFGWSNDEQLQQHDVQELSRILCSAINDSLAGTTGSNIIRDLYYGSIINQINCLECGTCSGREEDFLDLTLTISGNTGLEAALSRYYEETELLDGKNQYHCGHCQTLVDAKKGARLKKLPPILTISLLRFSYDFNKMERFKENGKFTFPLELDMSAYMLEPSEDEIYELFSVVIHQGSAYGGHYHAYIRDVDNLGTWYSPDDEKIQLEPSKGDKRLAMKEVETPLELLEAILLDHDDRSVLVDKLGSEIVSRTGKSWKHTFGKQFGQMTRYMKKHDNVFKFNQSTNTIQLKEGYSICKNTSDRSKTTCQSSTSTDLPSESPSTNGLDSSPSINGLPESGNCWFDYNDSRVSPISVKSLESQYQGKESAYMLFYRRKDLIRPVEASKNPSYCIEEELILDVFRENDEIHRQILDFETEVNQISVQIYFACNYTVTNGIVQSVTGSPEYTELTIDKRKTIAELLATIHEIGNEMVPREPVINRLTDLVSGFHIQDRLSDDVEKVLEDVGIKSQDKLLVWYGQVELNTAETYLTVTAGYSQYGGFFPKNMTLKLLIEQVSPLLNIPNKEKLRVKTGNCDNKSVILNWNDSLEMLELRDGDQLIVEETDSSDEKRDVSNDKDNKDEKDEREMTNDQLKSTQGPEVISNTQGPEVISNTQGPEVITNSMIKLWFSPVDNRSTVDDCITVDNSITVGECLQIILLQSSRPGDEWHLRKTNWCGEAWDVLDDDTVTLQSAGIQDGHHLLIEPGKLPPKGFLVLSIYLYPNISASSSTTNQDTGFISSITNSFHGLLKNLGPLTFGLNETEESQDSVELNRNYMGDVEISKESTLEELKYQIMTLPKVIELDILSIDFLRVRRLNNSRPATILRDLKHALKRHKVKTPEDLAIQVLPHSETLSTSDIILEVRVRQPESLTYSPSVEVLWDISHGNGIQSLKQAISNTLQLPVDQILLAKYLYQRFDWLILKEKEHVPVQSKKGKKKQKVQKVNLRQAPYNIGDGDIIGVKNLEVDQNKTDFYTQDDIKGKQHLQNLAEEKKKKKEEDIIEREVNEDRPQKRRPEVPLTIKVDKFT